MRSTHTYAIMDVSASTYDEIRAALEEAGYRDSIHGGRGTSDILDMHGIALRRNSSDPPTDGQEGEA